jgi:hypothetical protein
MLYVQEDDASLSEIGPYGSVRILDEYRDFSWRPGKSGEVFLRSGDAFSVVSALEKGRIVLGEVRVDTRGHEPWLESIRHPTVWDVVPNGLYVRVSDSFFELDRTGTLRHLGTQECDESQPGIMGIFLSKKKGDRRQFWHLTYQGVKVYLGSFPCEKWDAASDRIYIEYKGVLSRVIDGGRSLFKGKGRGVSEVIADVKGAHSWRPDAQGLWILRDGFFSRVADPLTRVNNLWWYSNPVICFMNEPIMQEAQSRF